MIFVVRYLYRYIDKLRGNGGEMKADENLLDIQDLKTSFETTRVVGKTALALATNR
jgi:hypothetical protein